MLSWPPPTDASKLCAKPKEQVARKAARTNRGRRMNYSVQRCIQAARYLSRHAVEQKWSSSPLTLRVMLAPVETYVPHTGSFFNSPPATTVGGADCGGVRT